MLHNFLRDHENDFFSDSARSSRVDDEENIPLLFAENIALLDDPIASERITIEATEPDKIPKSCCYQLSSTLLSVCGPGAVALQEGAQMAAAIYQDAIDSQQKVSIPRLALVSTIAFAASFGLNNEPTRESMEECYQILKAKKLPQHWDHPPDNLLEEWPPLTPQQERKTRLIVTAPALWGLITDGFKTHYYINTFNTDYPFVNSMITPVGLKIIAGFAIPLAIFTSLFTETSELYKKSRKRFSDYHEKAKHNNHWFTLNVGRTLGVIQSMQDALEGYVVIRYSLSIESLPYKLILLGLSSTNGVTNYCFSGIFGIESFQSFLDYIKEKEYKINRFEIKKVFMLALSFAAATGLAYFNNFLNEEFYHLVAEDFGIDDRHTLDHLFLYLSWVMFIQESLLNTASLYRPFTSLLNHLTNKISSLCGKIHESCSPNELKDNIELNTSKKGKSGYQPLPSLRTRPEDEPQIIYSTPHNLFQPAPKKSNVKSNQHKKFSCGIM